MPHCALLQAPVAEKASPAAEGTCGCAALEAPVLGSGSAQTPLAEAHGLLCCSVCAKACTELPSLLPLSPPVMARLQGPSAP